ncbi:MAG: hypothetical protein V4710_16060, partial [Verrucomicrobiota bacterium]
WISLDAINFQWESRQWDSLVLGVSLMDRRIQVSKLDLLQGHNRLNLSGDMALPLPGVKWWQSEFTCNIAATIDNLTELSALLLPEFQYAAGKANVDGSIRGRNQQFNGQLIVSGSKLTWHNAPIENLHAALNLDGNQCRISNVELFNNGDYVRGRGMVNILGPRQYSGELRASIDDLALYSAILQKPSRSEPLAGGAIIEWSGEGSGNGKSGKFLARLNKVRSLGALGSQLHPINIDVDGSYTQDTMQFSKFALADDESSFSANVGFGNKALSLKQIRLAHGSHVALTGDALLAVDVWQAWPNTSLATMLKDDTVSEVNLTATQLDLQRASKLAGWNFPIAGMLDGTLTVTGALNALKTGGKLTLGKGCLPLGWSGEAFTEVEATATFEGAGMTVETFTGRHRFGGIQLSGLIDLQKVRDPLLRLQVVSPDFKVPFFTVTGENAPVAPGNGGGVNGSATAQLPETLLVGSKLDLKIEGPASGATVQGNALIQSLSSGGVLQLTRLWSEENSLPLPPLFTVAGVPWNKWRFDVALHTGKPVKVSGNPGDVMVDTRLTGTATEPLLTGNVRFDGVTVGAAHTELDLSGTLTFHAERTRNPTLDLRAKGIPSEEPAQPVTPELPAAPPQVLQPLPS